MATGDTVPGWMRCTCPLPRGERHIGLIVYLHRDSMQAEYVFTYDIRTSARPDMLVLTGQAHGIQYTSPQCLSLQ
jgi:hypothetical protein